MEKLIRSILDSSDTFDFWMCIFLVLYTLALWDTHPHISGISLVSALIVRFESVAEYMRENASTETDDRE